LKLQQSLNLLGRKKNIFFIQLLWNFYLQIFMSY
jgi:hypothetical protein